MSNTPTLHRREPSDRPSGSRLAWTAAVVGTVVGVVALVGTTLLGGPSTPDPASLAATTATPSPAASPSPTPSATAPSPSASTVPSPTAAAPSSTRPVLSLAPDGLGYFSSPSSIRHLAFRDANRDTVIRVLQSSLGSVTEQSRPDCGTAITFIGRDGSGAVFDDGAFVGWVVQRGVRWTDPLGRGVGSSIGDFRSDAGPVTTRTTAAGLEFDTGSGAYSGLSPDGTETGALGYLAAGTVCGPR